MNAEPVEQSRFTDFASQHRALSVLAVLALLTDLHEVWFRTTGGNPGLGVAVSLAYLATIGLGVAGLIARGGAGLRRVDVAVLGLAIAIELIQLPHLVSSTYGYSIDEGGLDRQAMIAVLHGHNPYALHWPQAVGQLPTQLLNGHIVTTYPYPPLTAVLGAGLGLLHSQWASPALLDAIALIALTLFAFIVLPDRLRPVAVLVVLAVPFLVDKAWEGTPTIVALPLVAAALWRWTSVGANGRLSRRDIAQAVCLGLAASTQQLTWFLIPFLVVGMYRMHADNRGARRTLRMIAAYLAVAAAPFAVLNLPFAVVGFHDWFEQLASVITQHTIPLGVGVPLLTIDVLSGSGDLEAFAISAALVYLALLVIFAVRIDRLAPALVLLAMLPLMFTVRSLEAYETVFAPLAVLIAIGVRSGPLRPDRDPLPAAIPDPEPAPTRSPIAPVPITTSLFDPAPTTDLSPTPLATPAAPESIPPSPLPMAQPLLGRWNLIAPVLAVASFAALLVGLATPGPLKLQVAYADHTPAGRIDGLSVTAHNASGHVVTPHFLIYAGGTPGNFWIVTSGPTSLEPGATARFVLWAPLRSDDVAADEAARLLAVADRPGTVSAVSIPRQR